MVVEEETLEKRGGGEAKHNKQTFRGRRQSVRCLGSFETMRTYNEANNDKEDGGRRGRTLILLPLRQDSCPIAEQFTKASRCRPEGHRKDAPYSISPLRRQPGMTEKLSCRAKLLLLSLLSPAFLFLVAVPRASGQLKILTPKKLVSHLQSTTNSAMVPGAASTFGLSPYGEVILGRLYYVDSPSLLCKDDMPFERIAGKSQQPSSAVPTNSSSGSSPGGGSSSSGSSSTTTTTTTATPSNATSMPSMPQTASSSTRPGRRRLLAQPANSASSSRRSPDRSSSSDVPRTIKHVFLVRRGGCTFVEKVRHAEANEADAVVIVDHSSSSWDRSDIRYVVMADHGKGADITIPSVLISNSDGEALVAAARDAKSPVYVELEWSIPRKGVVSVDFWADTGREEEEALGREARQFLQEFAEAAKMLGGHLRFAIHFFLFDMPKALAKDLCWDEEGRFCAEAPVQLMTPTSDTATSADVLPQVTGRDVVEEDLRQLCLLRTTAKAVDGLPGSLYSQEFWEYIQGWIGTCSLLGSSVESRFSSQCSRKVMDHVNTHRGGQIDVSKVHQCMHGPEGNRLLEEDKGNQAWSPLTLRINEVRFSGRLKTDRVVKAVCAGFQTPPKACKVLVQQIEEKGLKALTDKIVHSSVFTSNNGSFSHSSATSDSVSSSSIWAVLFFAVVIVALSLYVYQRFLKTSMRDVLRAEIMMEVRTQLQEYQQLGGGGGSDDGARQARPLLF